MRKNGFLVVFLFFLLLSAESCQLAKLNDPIVVTDVEEEFYVDLIEDLQTEPRQLKFLLATIQEEPCENYRIQVSSQRLANRINLSINDIVIPDDCIPGNAPAKAETAFGALQNGFYRLSIDLKQTVFNDGQLTVSDDRYIVSMTKKEGIVFVQQELLKIPVNIAWGYLTYESEAGKALADQFIASLNELGENKSFTKGYYGYFHVLDDDGRVMVSQQPVTSQIQTFLHYLPRPGNRQALKDMLAEYRTQYAGEVNIKVFTDQGEEL